MIFNPKSAVVFMLTLLAAMLFFQHPAAILIMDIVLIAFYIIFRQSEKLKTVTRFSLYTSIMIIIINPLVNQGGTTELFRLSGIPVIGSIRITAQAVLFGIFMAFKLYGMMMIFTMYGFLTNSDDSFAFFSSIARKSSLTVSMSINIIHRLKEDVLRVKDVMILRGVDFEEKSISSRIRSYTPLLKVLLISALEGSLQRAEALEARGFSSGSAKRTSYTDLSVTSKDHMLFAAAAGVVILTVIFRSYGRYNFFT